MLFCGEGIGFAAYPVEGMGDVEGGAVFGAFEEQVFKEVGGA